VHLRFLRIDINDTRPHSEEEVTDLHLQFREASSLARSTWTEEEEAVLDVIIAEHPFLTVPGVRFPDGLYVYRSVDDGRGMTGQEDQGGHIHIQVTNPTPPTSQLDSSRRAPWLPWSNQGGEHDSQSLAPTDAVQWERLERARGGLDSRVNGQPQHRQQVGAGHVVVVWVLPSLAHSPISTRKTTRFICTSSLTVAAFKVKLQQ